MSTEAVSSVSMRKKETQIDTKKYKEELLSDPEAFISVYKDVYPRLFKYISIRVQSKEEAEDITSRTFEKALRNLPSYNPEKSSISTWIYSIANNLIVDFYRREQKRKQYDTKTLEEIFETNQAAADDIERMRTILEVMRELPEQAKEVLTLKFLNGLPHDEIAEILGVKSLTLSVRIYRALQALRENVKLYEEGSLSIRCEDSIRKKA